MSLLGLQACTVGEHGRPFGVEPLPGLGQLLDVGLQRLLAASEILPLLLQLGPASLQIAAKASQRFLALQTLTLDLRSPGLNLGASGLIPAGLLVEYLLPLRKLLGAPSQLFLQRGEHLLGTGQHGRSLAKRLTVCPQAFLLLAQFDGASL